VLNDVANILVCLHWLSSIPTFCFWPIVLHFTDATFVYSIYSFVSVEFPPPTYCLISAPLCFVLSMPPLFAARFAGADFPPFCFLFSATLCLVLPMPPLFDILLVLVLNNVVLDLFCWC
jgi:hypothetical protein